MKLFTLVLLCLTICLSNKLRMVGLPVVPMIKHNIIIGTIDNVSVFQYFTHVHNNTMTKSFKTRTLDLQQLLHYSNIKDVIFINNTFEPRRFQWLLRYRRKALFGGVQIQPQEPLIWDKRYYCCSM